MLNRYESTKLIAKSEVQSYFPGNVSELFGLEKNVYFFGLMKTGGYKQENVPVAKFKSLYLSVLYNTLLKHPDVLTSCDMKNSKRHRISEEGFEFSKLKKEHSELYSMDPLIILRLSSHLIKEDENFIFTELLRYADHEKFRGRGIATQVFEAICEKCRTDNLKYMYVDDRTKTGWPSRSRLIGKNWLTDGMFNEICATYYDKPRDEVFQVPYSANLIRILNDAEHEKLYQQMRNESI